MKINVKNYFNYIIVFFFFLIVGILIPYTGDDWNNLLFNGSLKSIINIAIGNYNSFEGRFFSRVFDLVFNYYRPIWIIANSLGMLFLYYFILKILNSKKISFFAALVIECLLLIDEESFSQVYVWITGNTTYFIPMLYLLLIIYINMQIFDLKEKVVPYKKYLYIILPLLGFVSCMFVENVAIGIISSQILIIIYDYIKNKRINYLMLACLLFSSVGLCLMLFSPGTTNRLNSMSAFDKMNILKKIQYTLPRQFNYVFIKNSFLIFLSTFSILFIIYKKIKGIKRIVLYLTMGIIPIITAVSNTLYLLIGARIGHLNFFLDSHNLFIFLYWCTYLAIFIIIIIKYLKTNKQKLLFFFLIALLNNAAMLISPLAGGRTTFLSTVMLLICVLIILNSLDIKLFETKWLLKLNNLFTIFIICIFVCFYGYCYKLDVKRTVYIRNQIENGKETIEIIKMPGKYLWNPNPYDDYHLYTFKKWYGISQESSTLIKSIKECEL